MKRLIIFVTLFSMTVHCASRMGFLSYLYQQRHDIAYRIGLIVEVPIALCGSDYDFNRGFNIEVQNTDDSTLPPVFSQAREIVLFFQEIDLDIKPESQILSKNYSIFTQIKYPFPGIDIFHPPS